MMTNSADISRKPQMIDSHPLAALAAAVGVAVAAQAFPRIRGHLAARRRQRDLINYLRDHLSGSDAGIQVVRKLASHAEDAEGQFFSRLADEFEEERNVVRRLLDDLGGSSQSPKRVAGHTAGALLSAAAGGRAGELSMFRTLEGLSIAVQGKRCLWRALQFLAPSMTGERRQFLDLEAQAVHQWEALESRRFALARATFPTS